MDKKTISKLLILVLLPFIMDYSINVLLGKGINNNSQILITMVTFMMMAWKYLGVIYWFLVGRIFASVFNNKVKGFFLGNIVWLILLSMYVWQFCILDNNSRNMMLTLISQCYILGFTSWATQILRVFTNTMVSTTIGILSYILMLIVFTMGFIYKIRSVHKQKYS